MTRNQRHAVELARGILEGRIQAAALSDAQWQLLLLASGLNSVEAGPLLVAQQVLDGFSHRSGYFAKAAPNGHKPARASGPLAV